MSDAASPAVERFDHFEGTRGYIASRSLIDAVNCALALERPLLVKGEPGTGKTLLAHHVAEGLRMKRNQGLTWSQVALAANAPMLTKAALVDGQPDSGVLPTGQVAGSIDELPTVAELVARIEDEALACLRQLGVPTAAKETA